MEYDVNRNEFVKTQKTKYVIQMSKHIFQIYMDGIVHDDKFLQVILLLCSNMFCEIFYLLCCFMFAGLKCNVHSSHWCLLPNTIQYNGFLQMETQLNMKLQMNHLQNDNWANLLKCWCVINFSYEVLHMQQ